MTLAAVDRIVHHSTIFELNVESYRRRAAIARTTRKPKGRPSIVSRYIQSWQARAGGKKGNREAIHLP
jgi:hypothetical protein